MMLKQLTLALLVASAVHADVALRPTRLALFKNGYGFVTLRGELDGAARTRLGPLPVPTAGTFWVGVGDGVQLKSLCSGLRDFPAANPAALEMGALIAANPGKKVSISYAQSGEEVGFASGTIIPMPPMQERAPGNVIGGEWKPSTEPVHYPIALLRTDNGTTLAVPTQNLRSLSFDGEFTMPTETQRRPAVELELAAPAPGGRGGGELPRLRHQLAALLPL